ALISSSLKPLAMRPITVEGSCPDLKPCMAATRSAGSRPASRGTDVSTNRLAGWQPEQEDAPGGGASAAEAGGCCATQIGSNVAAVAKRLISNQAPPANWPRARAEEDGPERRAVVAPSRSSAAWLRSQCA